MSNDINNKKNALLLKVSNILKKHYLDILFCFL